MSDSIEPRSDGLDGSPFDKIREEDDGSEYWSARDGKHGLFMTVTGDTLDELREQLRVQAEREASA